MGGATIAAVGITVSRQGRVHGWMTQELKASGGAVDDVSVGTNARHWRMRPEVLSIADVAICD